MISKAFTCPLRECSSSDWYAFPEDHRSPHDSWVQSITISEPSSGERQEKRGLEIHIQLLGAYHDGTIEFRYKRVLRYSLEGMRDVAAHGDWLEDEVNVKKHDSLLHRVKLTNGTFEIEAEDVEYKWTPLPSLSIAVVKSPLRSMTSGQNVKRLFATPKSFRPPFTGFSATSDTFVTVQQQCIR